MPVLCNGVIYLVMKTEIRPNFYWPGTVVLLTSFAHSPQHTHAHSRTLLVLLQLPPLYNASPRNVQLRQFRSSCRICRTRHFRYVGIAQIFLSECGGDRDKDVWSGLGGKVIVLAAKWSGDRSQSVGDRSDKVIRICVRHFGFSNHDSTFLRMALIYLRFL